LWVSQNEKDRQYYIIQRFIKLNADLYAQFRNNDAVLALQSRLIPTDQLMIELGTQTQRPVLYAVDEHNEIWKAGLEKNSFLRHFMIETGLCSGVCVMCVFSVSVCVCVYIYIYIQKKERMKNDNRITPVFYLTL
jgi:hypothetical protein